MTDSGDDEIAPYVELIRTELALEADSDAVAELAARLTPADAAERPPAKAPAVIRLGRALWSMRRRRVPAVSLDEFARDLRVLKLFDPSDAWSAEALDRLMTDVRPEPKKKRRRTPATQHEDPTIVPLRQPEER
jgi:hypothetical protein